MRRTALAALGAALLAGLVVSQVACRLLGIEGSLPSGNPILECRISVRNPEAEAEFGDEVPEQNLASRTEPFLADGVPLKRYSLNTPTEGHCPPGQGFDSAAAAAEDWRRLVRERIDQVEGDAGSGSIFNRFPGDWCEVPGTVECAVTDEPEGNCLASVLTEGDPLPECPPPPVPPACLEIACADEAACTAIDFGVVPTVARIPGQPPLGDGAQVVVKLTNCGAEDAGDLEVRGLDGTVAPVGALFDFMIPPGANSCHPANGDGEAVAIAPGASCELTVLFEPGNPGAHSARFAFSSDAQSELHEVALAGEGLGGTLAVRLGGADPAAELCFQGVAAGNCTAPRTLEATNDGPGVLTVSTLQTVAIAGSPNLFQLTPPAPFAIDVGATQPLEIVWCGATDERDRATLDLRANDPDQPSFQRDLEHRTAADPACPAGS